MRRGARGGRRKKRCRGARSLSVTCYVFVGVVPLLILRADVKHKFALTPYFAFLRPGKMMSKHGSSEMKVTAVDINPNAVDTVANAVCELGLEDRITPLLADILPDFMLEDVHDIVGVTPSEDGLPEPRRSRLRPDLIVFNPPWLPVTSDEGEQPPIDSNWIEGASYRDASLIPRFFEKAHAALAPGGRVVVIYTNFAQVVGRESIGPVEVELARPGSPFELISSEVVPVPRPRATRRPNANRGGGRVPQWKARVIARLETQLWVLKKKK